ncbi:MAG: ABC transporter ATP-binding protein [Phycisphaerae bacterium]|nr:ABC transporter ATP-binding protein [Phycisphaerae bacterium]
MIRIENIAMRFGKTAAVNGVSLHLDSGDSVALWGANGAGKTTLIRCVLGLLRYRGRITLGGHDVRRHGKRARLLVGYVPQEIGFYDDLGVAEAVRFFGRLKGLSHADAGATLDRVGLHGHEHKRIRELSGGMKQRLALAIALLGDPAVLVLDEVTASLDAVGRGEFLALLEQLSGMGRTLLFASHRIEEVASLAKRVAVLEHGRLKEVVPCGDFAARIARNAVLHLSIAAPIRKRAVELLSAEGLAPQLNGAGLLVPVAPEHKAVPFRILADAHIPVDDFELVSHEHAARIGTERMPEEDRP